MGLFFYAMELDTCELFRCLARDCNYRDEKLCDVSKADYIASMRLYIALKAQKLLEVSEVFWSFTCIFKSKLLCTQSCLTKSDGRNIKLRCYRESRNSNSGTSNVFSETTPWLQTPMTRNLTAIMPMDIHKQAIEKSCRQVEFERQAVRTKATRSALRLCLHIVDRTFIYNYTNFLLLWIWQI